MEMKIKLTLILIALLLVSAAPAAPDGWPPRVMNMYDKLSYRTLDHTNGIWMIWYYYLTTSACSVAVYWWDNGWQYHTGITIPIGGVYEEDALIPRIACVDNYVHIQVSSNSLTSPKALAPNPGYPMTFVHLLLGQ